MRLLGDAQTVEFIEHINLHHHDACPWIQRPLESSYHCEPNVKVYFAVFLILQAFKSAETN